MASGHDATMGHKGLVGMSTPYDGDTWRRSFLQKPLLGLCPSTLPTPVPLPMAQILPPTLHSSPIPLQRALVWDTNSINIYDGFAITFREGLVKELRPRVVNTKYL